MGDRRNIVLNFGNGTSVALYTHYDGSNLPYVLANALKRGKSRWNDYPYLTRIIFSEMLRDDDIDGTTGYGIMPHLSGTENYTESDSKYDIFVNLEAQTVGQYPFEKYIQIYA